MKKFFMVYVDGRSCSTRKFESLEEAETEARRLLEKERVPVYVLETYCIFELTTIKKTIL